MEHDEWMDNEGVLIDRSLPRIVKSKRIWNVVDVRSRDHWKRRAWRLLYLAKRFRRLYCDVAKERERARRGYQIALGLMNRALGQSDQALQQSGEALDQRDEARRWAIDYKQKYEESIDLVHEQLYTIREKNKRIRELQTENDTMYRELRKLNKRLCREEERYHNE